MSYPICTFVLFLSIFCPFSYGAARFTQVPSNKLYVFKGETARFVWDYHVDNINELDSASPTWSFYDPNAKRIGYDYKYDSWNWWIDNNTCPLRLRSPTVRVSKQSTATLVITGVTTADNGEYGCTLVLKQGGSLITSKVQLIVTETPTFTVRPNASTTINEHSDLRISCLAVGPPTPNVTWVQVQGITKVTMTQGVGSATLSIPNIKRVQNGTYECQLVNNPNQNPVTAQTKVIVYYPPDITTSPDNTTVTQGKVIILKCQASGNPQPTRTWSRGNNVLTGHTISDDTLTIPEAVKSDAGKYICTAMNVYGGQSYTATAHAYVTVEYPPTIGHHSNISQIINETDSLSLTCTADGYPEPTITWTKSPGTITKPNIGIVYTISSVKRSDTGTYKCTAGNGILSDAMTSIQVTVQYKPKIDTASSSNNIKSWNGHTITLRCKWSSALPNPDFTWYKPNGDRITSNVRSITSGSEVMVVTGQDSGDYGLYRCIATNVVGSDQHNITVTQLFPPGPPNITVTDIEASSVIVRWTRPMYDGGSPIIDYKLLINSMTHNISASNTLNKDITGLTKDTEYKVQLYARNVVGYGNASSKNFTTKKQGPPSLPELEVRIHQTSVTLTWSKPDENGGEIIKYTIHKKVIGMDGSLSKIDVTATLFTYTVENLDPGKKYSFIVTAWNKYGESLQDDNKAKTVIIPVETVVEPTKGKSSADDDSNQTIIIACSVVAAILILITVIISIVILRKKKVLGQGKSKSSRSESAAYHNDVETSDSVGRQAAVLNIGDDDQGGIPTYAAVDMTKKKKKGEKQIPEYAVVDKTKKKKRPGEIIYAELADFKTGGAGAAAAATLPVAYTETDYADISQYQNSNEPEPMYANFPGRNKEFANIHAM